LVPIFTISRFPAPNAPADSGIGSPARPAMKPVSMLPNLLTLGNSACGLLAISKAVDALAYTAEDESFFYRKMEAACSLVFLGMVFDALDGRVARLTKQTTEFGAQMDSFTDLISFGVADWYSEARLGPVFAIVILCVTIPCCLSDILFPLAIARKEGDPVSCCEHHH